MMGGTANGSEGRGGIWEHTVRCIQCAAGLRGNCLGGDKARCCSNYIKGALSPKVLSKMTRIRKI